MSSYVVMGKAVSNGTWTNMNRKNIKGVRGEGFVQDRSRSSGYLANTNLNVKMSVESGVSPYSYEWGAGMVWKIYTKRNRKRVLKANKREGFVNKN